MIDFHTHILPNMDDGSKSVDESIQLLNILKNEGVKLVCLTSHFYPRNESIEDFLERRNKSYKELNYNNEIKVLLGSEVHYYRGISTSEDIDKLCIENTNILLVELPFSTPINENIINEIVNLKNRGLRVILAHVERYKIDFSTLQYLHNNGVMLQCNTEFFLGFFSSKRALKWLENGIIDVIGSDCHNLIDRIPNYDKAMNIVKKNLGEDFLNNFVRKTYNIIER